MASQEGTGNKYSDLSRLLSNLLRLPPIGQTQVEAGGLMGTMEARLLGPRETEVERGFARVNGNYPVYIRSFAD